MTTATAKTKSGMSALSLVYSGMFAALMMIGANITAFAPFLTVGRRANHASDIFRDPCRFNSRKPVRRNFNDGLHVCGSRRSSRFREVQRWFWNDY